MNYEIEKITTDIVVQAAALEVRDQASASRATELILAGKDAIKKIKAFFAPMKESAWTAHQEVVQKEKAELGKIEPAVSLLGERISRWRAEEARKCLASERERARIENERKRIEEETLRKAREADEKAERERRRLELEAEEINRKAMKTDDEAALKRLDEAREKLRLEADELRKIADAQTTLAIDEGAAAESALPSASTIQEAPRTTGLAMRENWCFEIVDPAVVPREYLIIDEVKIGKVVRAVKGQITIPGVRIFNKPFMAEIGKRNKA